MSQRSAPPQGWLEVRTDPPAAPAGRYAVLHGPACRTTAALFAEFARALRLPAWFGHNWDALADCLRDLTDDAGQPGLPPGPAVAPGPGGGPGPDRSAAQPFMLVVTDAQELLAGAGPGPLRALLAVLTELAGRPAGLRVRLHCPAADAGALRGRLSEDPQQY